MAVQWRHSGRSVPDVMSPRGETRPNIVRCDDDDEDDDDDDDSLTFTEIHCYNF